jgi:hypothetical protein
MDNPNSNNYKKVRILLISNMNTGPSSRNIQSKKEMIYDTLKNSSLTSEIIVVSFESIKHFNELTLSYYHCIIYDLLDNGCEIQNPTKEIENYIKNGGSIIVTHDHIRYGLEDILGLKFNGNKVIRLFKKVKMVNFEHKIWNSFYNLENWRTIDIVETHNHYNILNNETQQVMLSYDNYNDLYLTTRNLGMGKAIFWNAGHLTNINEDEKKLLINIVAWILKGN